MGDFGTKTEGGSGLTLTNYRRGSYATGPATGKAESITAFVRGIGGSTTLNIKCALYLESDDSLVGSTEERSVSLTPTPAWETFNFSAPKPDLSAVDYWILAWAGSDGYMAALQGASETAGGGYESAAYDGWPATWTPTTSNNRYSIYCTYSAGVAYSKTLTEALGLLDHTIRRDAGKVLPEILGLVDLSIIKGVEVTKTELLGLLDVDIRKDVEITKSELLGLLDVLETAYGKGYSVTLTEILGLSDTIVKSTQIQLSEILGLVDTLIKLRLRPQTRILAPTRILDPFRILPPERVQGPS